MKHFISCEIYCPTVSSPSRLVVQQCRLSQMTEDMQVLLRRQHCQLFLFMYLMWQRIMTPPQGAFLCVKMFPVKPSVCALARPDEEFLLCMYALRLHRSGSHRNHVYHYVMGERCTSLLQFCCEARHIFQASEHCCKVQSMHSPARWMPDAINHFLQNRLAAAARIVAG